MSVTRSPAAARCLAPCILHIGYCIFDGMLHVAFWKNYSIFNHFSIMKEQPVFFKKSGFPENSCMLLHLATPYRFIPFGTFLPGCKHKSCVIVYRLSITWSQQYRQWKYPNHWFFVISLWRKSETLNNKCLITSSASHFSPGATGIEKKHTC